MTGQRHGRDGRRCVVRGCERFVKRGKAVCRDHARSAAGRRVQELVGRMTADAVRAVAAGMEGEGRRLAGERFRRRAERGDYGALVDERIGRSMAEVALRLGPEDGVRTLRVVLGRLLDQAAAGSDEPVRLTAAILRVATAMARAERG